MYNYVKRLWGWVQISWWKTCSWGWLRAAFLQLLTSFCTVQGCFLFTAYLAKVLLEHTVLICCSAVCLAFLCWSECLCFTLIRSCSEALSRHAAWWLCAFFRKQQVFLLRAIAGPSLTSCFVVSTLIGTCTLQPVTHYFNNSFSTVNMNLLHAVSDLLSFRLW